MSFLCLDQILILSNRIDIRRIQMVPKKIQKKWLKRNLSRKISNLKLIYQKFYSLTDLDWCKIFEAIYKWKLKYQKLVLIFFTIICNSGLLKLTQISGTCVRFLTITWNSRLLKLTLLRFLLKLAWRRNNTAHQFFKAEMIHALLTK